MENNGMFSNALGLEMSLNHHHNHHQTPNFLHQQPPYSAAKQITEEEEPHTNNLNNPATTEDSGGDGKLRKGSPWQRMKWTDNMVRLLIMVVFYVGDEAGSDQPPATDTPARKKSGGSGGGGGGGGGGVVLQKKGKWKSVSLAMMERGFYVSPQQCEDKFNDLNKRYKRVNDILGKGTACKVVENQSLLETMDHIPVKLKEEVKKLLNSKHLFFREMCAYHNSCGGGGGGGTGGGGGGGHHASPSEVGTVERHSNHSHQRANCVHSNGDDDDEDEDEMDDENDEEGDRDDEEDDGLSSRKRGRTMENNNNNNNNEDAIRQFNGELSSMVQDMTKSVWEKRQWMKVKMMQLEEQRVGFQGQSYELEKRRSKWLKFSYSKEREMEIERLKNERMKLENERMVLLLRQKEMELVDHQQQYSSNVHKRVSDPSSING